MSDGDRDVTTILQDFSTAPERAADELMPLVYAELRALAQSQLARERPDHTLQATAVVHEAYLKLVDQQSAQWQNRAHFFAVAAQAIRRILVDHARTHSRVKRGGRSERVALDSDIAWTDAENLDLLSLDECLEKLTALNERHAKVVTMRFFGGLGLKEVAEVLGVSLRTVEGDWSMARAWLKRELDRDMGATP